MSLFMHFRNPANQRGPKCSKLQLGINMLSPFADTSRPKSGKCGAI